MGVNYFLGRKTARKTRFKTSKSNVGSLKIFNIF